ncbi:ankyrin repeat domain-containing protein [Piscirickettsia salmonis]|uniref:ankyrin repeat domain-containing protein n=1 Tax=Piscirickettsia salmonis TaxID=1238 RepID=UPI0007C914B1|nr:Ankyrin repeats (3 copies) [Piscirickettsiaceae bacterium NZ-RLO1]
MKFFCIITHDNYPPNEMIFYAVDSGNDIFSIRAIAKESFLKLTKCPMTRSKNFFQLSYCEYNELLNKFKEEKPHENIKKKYDEESFHSDFSINKKTFKKLYKNKKSHKFIGMDIFDAIKEKNHKALKEIAKLDKSYLSNVDENGNTPLATAIICGNIKALQILKEHGVNIKQNINDTSPINLAKQHNQTKVIRFYENDLLFENLTKNIKNKGNIDEIRKIYS